MSTLKAVRGTRDLLPSETGLWNRIEAIARSVFERYNFGEIRTPVFEDTALFARGVGEETDIVSKEMYTWEDRARAQSEKSQMLTLRPENTAGVVRAYIEHKLGETGQLQKLYYIGPQFRRERPQKGRYRQFSQIGAEVIGPVSAGSESPLRDAEVLDPENQFRRLGQRPPSVHRQAESRVGAGSRPDVRGLPAPRGH
jgi:histidyl-tRNA synthetase